jgi:hypothetical protein
MKCSKCNEKIEETFLGKIKGTYVKGKAVCSDCQKKPQ